jgi:uncharacterized protein (TIGR02099 family)
MSIVSTSNRWLNSLYKTVAILLVALAVLISAFRLFLPYVHYYRIPLQNYLNEKSQANMSIGTLSMIWQRSGPTLVIGDVQVFKTENASVFIKQLELQVDFWQTISTQNLISKNLIISGAKVDISDKLWLVNKGDDVEKKADNEVNNIEVISNLFLSRIKHFSVRDSQIIVKNKTISRSIRLNQLRWLNEGDRHQAEGSLVLNGLSSNNVKLKVDLQGEHARALTGQVYLQANHIDITPWLDKILVLDDDKIKTDINFSAWLKVSQSNIKRLHIDVAESSMSWFFDKTEQKLSLDQGQLLLVRGKREHNFKLYSTPLSLQINDKPTQTFTTMLTKQASNFSLHLSEIDMAMLSYLTPLIVEKKVTRDLLSDMALSGKVSDLFIRKKNDELQIVSNLFAFNTSYSHGVPGIDNVSGQLSYNHKYLSVSFEAKEGNLDFNKLFVQAFPYKTLSGQLNASVDDNGWALTIEKLDLVSKEINLSAQMKIEAPIQGETNVALLANVTNGNAGLVGRYLPLSMMSGELVNYLNAAVVSGRIEEAQILINGPISRFPFSDGSGVFVVDAELSKSEFKFFESWPAITDFVANLNFTNNAMLITGRDGELTGLDVKGIRVGIADLAEGQILTVDAEIKPTPAHYIGDLMSQSSLKGSVGSVLEQLQIKGEVSGDFHLNLPLNNSEKAVAYGTINFDNNEVALQTPRMDFSDVYGQLSFSNDKISTKYLSLQWQGLPVLLDINGMNKADYYDTDINLTARWKASEWLTHVPESLQQYVQGDLPWYGKLSLNQHHQGGFSYTGDFVSDLINTELILPELYANNKIQKNKLTVQISGQTAQSKMVLNYSDKMKFSGVLDHSDNTFTRANLMLGEGSMLLASDGFHITTKLAQADFSVWQPLISDVLNSINQSTSTTDKKESRPLLATPKRIRGSIGQLSILGQQLNNVSFNLLDKPQWWLLQLNAKETRSQIKIYPHWLTQGLDINAEFLRLPKTDEKEEVKLAQVSKSTNKTINKAENDIIFANTPSIKFHCDSCSIGLLDLGEIDANIKRVDQQTIEFTDFNARRNKTTLALSGLWQHNDEVSTTTLTGKLLVDDIEAELQALGYESIIKDSGGKMKVNLNWAGGLHDFNINQLDGSINARLDDGYLADIKDKARMFSVLSLQSLVRKLTLDFRDIFSDGMFYSRIKGDYQLKKGLLTTDNTEMSGTAGDLFMRGHTDLTSGELDYTMSYKPNLTSSLPVLAWIATLNPVTFLAGVAIDQVIKSQVVSEFTFELTGTVDNPDFKEVDRKSKNISVDATIPPEDVKPEELEGEKAPLEKATKNNKGIDDKA